MVTNDVKLFSGTTSRYLSEKIADYYGQPLGKMQVDRFSDGEFQPNILESVRGSYVFFIQSTFFPSDNLMELLLMIDAAKRASTSYITAVIPYFGLARQDRKDKPRVSIGSKLVAELLTAAGANRIITMDLHADQIQGFFDIPVDHLNSTAIYVPYIEENLNLENVVFASPDVGSTKRNRKYAVHFNTELVICDKFRKKANEIAGMTVIGDVSGKDVIMIDDIVDTGNTLANAASIMLDKGAKSVQAFCTHPVLSGKAYETIEASKLKQLVVTDTIPLKRESEKITVLSSAKLFARAIRNTHEHRSISSLFINN
ncbi:MAG: ribose-phosphate pyrophosphokinase [Bacteroidetes bacterium]|nr:ribose-phosphate pyrophosphokinase [Bacteroidota bacterium]MBP7399441.1 ribose-phosphate pyrophosphokinase [Chitinophagales bacterium]MBK7107602.1 ribose-phosphate pyrophosphokinase [Bacteroidota bacterium]MBK8486991.1 ribose-phosphate pyrophosphokinase [Bacteroidota bacterium]MBK8680360.1 ribose-phosphate pyrophosphokinase [Bacteroidota bacterium]